MWLDGFYNRHYEELAKRWSTSHDKVWADALNPAKVNHWFHTLSTLISEHNIKPQNIYNMDETGIMFQETGKIKVIVLKDFKSPKMVMDTHRESMSLVTFVGGDGTVYPLMAIFKGTLFNPQWAADNPLDCRHELVFYLNTKYKTDLYIE